MKRQPVFPEGDATILQTEGALVNAPCNERLAGAEATIGAKTNGICKPSGALRCFSTNAASRTHGLVRAFRTERLEVITEEREGILPFEANTFLQQSS